MAVQDGPVIESSPQVNLGVYEEPKMARRDTILEDEVNIDHTYQEIRQLRTSFEHVDRGLKELFGGIRVPSKDGLRSEPMRVRIAGGDKTILLWERELEHGSKRVKLPVMSINRESHQPNPRKQFPAYHPASWVYTEGGRRARIALAPKAFIIGYSMNIWANRKSDAEYIADQILQEFDHGSQLRFQVDMGTQIGTVILEFQGMNDISDVEVDSETKPRVQYEIALSAEAWLPLPEVIVPTILGQVMTLHERTGVFLDVLEQGVRGFVVSPFNLPDTTVGT